MLQQQHIKLLFIQDQVAQKRPDLMRLPLGLDLKECRKPRGRVVGQVLLGKVADILDGLVPLVGRFLGVDDALALYKKNIFIRIRLGYLERKKKKSRIA